MRIADAIFQRLEKETDTVFFLPGGGAMFLVDALGKSNLRRVAAIHEAGAGAMALGYAMATGRLGVCLVTSGPGATNAITPCLAAWMDGVRILFISGQARTQTLVGDSGLRSRGVQEADIISMVKPITKEAKQTGSLSVLEHMLYLSKHGRPGPVWLSVPMDIQGAEHG